MLKDIFGPAKHQENATYGIGYKLPLTRNSGNSNLKKDNATNFGKTKIIAMDWYVPHYTCSIPEQFLIFKQILSKLPTEL